MNYREANISDIEQILVVRNSVTENRLSNPELVTNKDCEVYLTERGKGWVCEIHHRIVGFAIVDLTANNVWALFVHPEYEKQGIGKQLHKMMLDWYFEQSNETIWLGTSPNTRAAMFYTKSGWQENGKHGNDEIKFEMSLEQWTSM